MKLTSALQDWYSACRDEKLREFGDRCLDEYTCAIPLLKWAASYLEYLGQSEIDKIARSVVPLPDPPGGSVTPLAES